LAVEPPEEISWGLLCLPCPVVHEFAGSAFSRRFILLLIAAACFGGCSSDPNQRKLRLVESGVRYFSNGKYKEATIQFRNAIQIDPKFAAAHYQLARAYLAEGNSQAAYREFNQTIGLDPANADAKMNAAKLLIGSRQFTEAQTLAQTVIRTDPRNAEAHAILGQKYLLTHNLPNALAELRKAVDLNPQRVEGYAAVGSVYLAQGKPEEAEAAYQKAVQVKPNSVQAHMALGEFFFAQHKMAQAEAALRTACTLDARAVTPRLLLGRTYVLTGQSGEAEDLYAKLKAAAPDDPRAYQALGLYYLSSGQKDKAVSEFQSLAGKKPKDKSVQAYLIETLLDLNRVNEADPLIQKALSAKGDDPRILLASGRLLVSEGKYREAIERLEKTIKLTPGSASAFYFLGMAQKGAGLLDVAKASFAQALKLSPQMSPAAAAIASLDVRSGNQSDALQMADKALVMNPGSAEGHIARGRALIAKGDIQRGESEIQEALRSDPVSLPALAMLVKLSVSRGNTPDVIRRISGLLEQHQRNAGLHLLLALCYFSTKDLDKAEAGVKRALALDPGVPDAWTLQANIDLARGATGKAESDFRSAIAAQPRSVSNYVALGTQFERENRWEEARKLFEKAHEMEPNSPYVSAELAFLYLEHGGDVNVAVSLAQMAKQKMPESPMTADALGWAYYKLGSTDLAIAQLKESAAKTPDNPVYQYHLGMAYLSARRMDMAARSLRIALKEDPNFPYAQSARTALEGMAQPKR
jgi:tetratricopeptide (TPR) repeat protein